MSETLTPADRRDLARLNTLGGEVQQQVTYLRRNSAHGHEDRLRYMFIARLARELTVIADRGLRRYRRARKAAA